MTLYWCVRTYVVIGIIFAAADVLITLITFGAIFAAGRDIGKITWPFFQTAQEVLLHLVFWPYYAVTMALAIPVFVASTLRHMTELSSGKSAAQIVIQEMIDSEPWPPTADPPCASALRGFEKPLPCLKALGHEGKHHWSNGAASTDWEEKEKQNDSEQ